MNITKIETHSQDAQNRLLYQYQNSDNLKSLIDIIGQRAQDIEDTIYQLFRRLNIDLQTGIQLDKIGDIVGQDRYGFSDEIYRLFLKARVGKNVSESDSERIIAVWKLITQSDEIHLVEAFPGEVDLYYDTEMEANLAIYAFDLIQDVVGAGINVGYIAVTDQERGFSFESTKNNRKGFGSYYHPTINCGKFSWMQNIREYAVLYTEPVFSFYPSDPDKTTGGFGSQYNPTAEGGKLAWINR